MNTRSLVWISLALNLALATVFFLTPANPSSTPKPTTTPPAVPPVASTPIEPAPTQAIPIAAAETFRWSQLASDDLKVYRDNLLAIGCPRPTVRDIIMGEINERFVHQRQALMASLQSRYWEFLVRGEAALRTELGKPIEAIAEERGALIDEVLGRNFAPAEFETREGRGDTEQQLSWLPEEKRSQLLALEQKRDQTLEALRKNGQFTAEDEARRQALEQEFEKARNELLSPEELEQLDLRSSKESLWAAGLSGFEPTEKEWREVTELRAKYNDALSKLSDPGLSAESRRELTEALETNLDSAMRRALGDRYAQYEMANNEDFQTVHKVTQRYGLEDSVAARAYQVRQSAVTEAEKVRSDSTLSAEQRQAALTAIQQETEHALADTLGKRVFATYVEYGGGWLADLNRSGDE